jgi:hypothetical protein
VGAAEHATARTQRPNRLELVAQILIGNSENIPQGLKPLKIAPVYGTAKAVP